MKKIILSFIFAVCLIIPSVMFLGACNNDKDEITPTPEPVNEVKVILSDNGKTLYRFAPDNDETEYTVPEGVTIIGVSAFEDCDNLTKVTLPTTLRYVLGEAFKDCDNLATVEINSDIEIGEESFYNCVKLATIDTSKITSYGTPGVLGTIPASYAFFNCDALTSITIAKEVTDLPKGVYSNTSSLTTVNFEEDSTLMLISEEAFYFSSVSSIILPQSCKYIYTRAFAYSGLTSITIGKNITLIRSYAFAGCDNLLTVEFETGRTEVLKFNDIFDDSYGGNFTDCSNLVTVTNYPAQSGILDDMFKDCAKLKTFTFASEECQDGSDGVRAVCKYAFHDCESLEQIELPKYIIEIKENAFSYCDSLQTIKLVAINRIGDDAFRDCDNLSQVVLVGYDTTIGHMSFYYCLKLETIVIDDTVIANNLVGEYDNGYLVAYATTIYIKEGLEVDKSTYLLENFTKQATSDKTGYDMYVKNAE